MNVQNSFLSSLTMFKKYCNSPDQEYKAIAEADVILAAKNYMAWDGGLPYFYDIAKEILKLKPIE